MCTPLGTAQAHAFGQCQGSSWKGAPPHASIHPTPVHPPHAPIHPRSRQPRVCVCVWTRTPLQDSPHARNGVIGIEDLSSTLAHASAPSMQAHAAPIQAQPWGHCH